MKKISTEKELGYSFRGPVFLEIQKMSKHSVTSQILITFIICVTLQAHEIVVAEMNRHHYSLYVHNCRLVFLLRRDFTQIDTFRPAEFHWKLEQVRRVYEKCEFVCV